MAKIIYVITQGEMGGAQRYVFDLATQIAKPRESETRNYAEIIVAHGAGDNTLSMKLGRQGIKTHQFKYLQRNISPLREILALKELYGFFKIEQPDVVHLNSSKAGVLGSIAAKMARVPKIIYTAHGWAFKEPGLIKKVVYWKSEWLTSIFKDKIICVSENDRQIALKYHIAGSKKLVTIHNGIDLHETRSTRYVARDKMSELMGKSIAETDVVFGTIAHDYKTKDLPTLYKAAEIVRQATSNKQQATKFFIAGRGSKVGAVNASELMSGLDIYVMSSVKEGFPYSILESLALGIPIVSTAVGGIPEAVRDKIEGFLVQPKKPELLAEKILELVQKPDLRHSMSLACKERAKEFTLDKMLDKTLEVYNRESKRN